MDIIEKNARNSIKELRNLIRISTDATQKLEVATAAGEAVLAAELGREASAAEIYDRDQNTKRQRKISKIEVKRLTGESEAATENLIAAFTSEITLPIATALQARRLQALESVKEKIRPLLLPAYQKCEATLTAFALKCPGVGDRAICISSIDRQVEMITNYGNSPVPMLSELKRAEALL